MIHVGWIGMGNTGKPMAKSVHAAGHALIGYARRPEAHEDLTAAGVTVTNSPIKAVEGADVVCVNLFSEEQIREVVIGAGALAAMRSGAILAVHSTVSADFIRELGAIRDDISVLDAGFSGGGKNATEGTITLMVGGDESALHRAEPVFKSYSNYIAHVGPLGAGMILKLANNLVHAAQTQIVKELLHLLERNDMAVDVCLQTLARGSANSGALASLNQGVDRNWIIQEIRRYAMKDVQLALDAFGRQGIETIDLAARRLVNE